MGLPVRRSKTDLLRGITKAFKEYEAYKKDKLDKYVRGRQLGDKGKEGTTYAVTSTQGKKYAMKTFRKQKSSATLQKEAELQKLAADVGAAPNILDVDTVSKYIVMERMDSHLLDRIKVQGFVTKEQQKQIINIYLRLDKAKVLHGDANLLNYMYRKDRLYIIDFGMAKEVTVALVQKLGTDSPNIQIMTLGLALKLRDMGFSKTSYDYIIKYLSEEQRSHFGFVSHPSKKKGATHK
jgi:predicted Ser/Thr protein kinase